MTRIGHVCSVLGIAGALMCSSSVQAEFRFGFEHWYGQSYNSSGGNFKNCIASLHNENDQILIIKLDKNLDLSIGVSDSEWNLETGETVVANFWFDHSVLYNGLAVSTSKDVYFTHLVRTVHSLHVMQIARMALVDINGQTILFSLNGIAQTLSGLVACVKQGTNARTTT